MVFVKPVVFVVVVVVKNKSDSNMHQHMQNDNYIHCSMNPVRAGMIILA